MFLLSYYGVDWLMFLLFLVHLWMLGNKWRTAFIFGILGAFSGCVLGILANSFAFTIMNAVFIYMHIRAYKLWIVDSTKEQMAPQL